MIFILFDFPACVDVVDGWLILTLQVEPAADQTKPPLARTIELNSDNKIVKFGE